MLSHISNEEVRRIACERPLTQTVLFRQLLVFGKIARAPETSEMRAAIFQHGSVNLKKIEGKRSAGRPRLRWDTVVSAHAIAAAGSKENLNNIICNSNLWRAAARIYSYPS